MNGKKIIAALGLLGVLATPKIQASLAAKEFDIVNGLLGMNRDIIIRLVKIMTTPAPIRNTIGMSRESFPWKEHFGFIEARQSKERPH
ncbi:hypothetical protein AGMMS49949_08870 [Alphaproteobacteria bacterium]|nr:hypothetical protein AGMMS49949_08870 [Alphaproteobacteria bacterium]GHS99870.1 hypothetical protein AGMMS50296_8120 [Alphaproteobacteria bacterium]